MSTASALQGFADRVHSGEYAASLSSKAVGKQAQLREYNSREVTCRCSDGIERTVSEAAKWEVANKPAQPLVTFRVTEIRTNADRHQNTRTHEFLSQRDAEVWVFERGQKLYERGWTNLRPLPNNYGFEGSHNGYSIAVSIDRIDDLNNRPVTPVAPNSAIAANPPCPNCGGSSVPSKTGSGHFCVNCYRAGKPHVFDTTVFPAPSVAVEMPQPISGNSVVPDGTYTVVRGSEHRTFRIKTADKGNLAGKRILEYLAGPDNESDYVGFAFFDERAGIQVWRRFRNAEGDGLIAFASYLAADWKRAGEFYALQSGRCFICNRKLTVPSSISKGIGPDCAGRLGL